MSYNFLDCDIYSTPFGQLDNPDAVASTATARIRSKAEDFADFAALMSPIPVRLVCGKVNLAVPEVSIKVHYLEAHFILLRGFQYINFP